MNSSAQDNVASLHKKTLWIMIVIVIFVFIVGARLYYLQVIKGDFYNRMATEIFVREEEIVAKRGLITDRDGRVLADTRTYFEIVVTPQYLTDRDRVIENLVRILPLKKEEILAKLYEARFEPRFSPVVIAGDVSYEWAALLREHLSPTYEEGGPFDLSGIDVREIPIRRYLYPFVFAHALGYLREIDKTNLAKAREKYPGVFSLGDLTGAAGVEESYDIPLKGTDGVIGRVVDARGREVVTTEDLKVLEKQVTTAPVPGNILKTTLDFDAQLAAHEALKGKKGAVVALDPQTGAVLVLYSSPGYDANLITKSVDRDYWKLINLHPDKILYNRTIQAMYPPASTYKMVGLTAGIDSGKVDPEKTVLSCAGGLFHGNRMFKCWSAHGPMKAVKALGQSCDTFFYRVGLMLGVDELAKYAHMFGFGSKTGIDIPFEKPGLIPTSEWKQRVYKQRWYESETLSVAIGQSYDLVTPLQQAVAVSVIANSGYLVKPHLGMEILDPNGKRLSSISPQPVKSGLFGSKALSWVKLGMINVVQEGTARRLKDSPYKIAGKTGTAQVVGHGSKVKRGTNTEAHALFNAFAPYDDPKIAVAVVVEHGRGGALAAAPVARLVIEAYLSKLDPELVFKGIRRKAEGAEKV